MALRLASADTVDLPLSDGDWVRVRTEIAKRDFNKFIKYMPGREVSKDNPDTKLTPAEAVELQTGMFEALVVAWSAPMPATVESYLNLGTESAGELDEALANHFKSLTPSKEEEKAGF